MGATASKLDETQINELKEKFGESITDSMLEETSRIFRNLDVVTDGKLSREEFSASLGMMGTENSMLGNFLFDAIDIDRNGDVDLFEFINFLFTISVGSEMDKLEFGFRLIDLDKNGKISKEEVVTFIKTFYQVLTSFELQGIEVDKYANELCQKLDFNEDGEITKKEYLEGCLRNESFIKNLGSHKNSSHGKPAKKIGKQVFIGQEKWDFMLSVMLGLQVAIEKTPPLNGDLQQADFDDIKVFDLHSKKQEVLITSYASRVFLKIREQQGVSEEEYSDSLGIKQVLGSLLVGDLRGLSELVSEGRSGSFFYFSPDLKFMVKTISSSEKNTLCRILPHYCSYMIKNKDTLLTRICGLYKLKWGDKKSRFIVMSNVFPPGIPVHTRYDLKGSTQGRTVGDHLIDKPGVVLKDLDLLKKKTQIHPNAKYLELLKKQINDDSEFLQSQGIIDYSLLIGIHEKNKGSLLDYKTLKKRGTSFFKNTSQLEKEEEERQRTVWRESNAIKQKAVGCSFFQSDEGGMLDEKEEILYFFGIIDILIEYETFKQGEHALKSVFYDSNTISVCPPSQYGPRFRSFTSKIFDSNPTPSSSSSSSSFPSLLSPSSTSSVSSKPLNQ